MSGSFADTNVLLYLTSDDRRKADIAETVLRNRPTISVQVLNEFVRVSTQKFRFDWPAVEEMLTAITRASDVRALTLGTHQRGVALAQRHRLHIYDAMIIGAALEADCDVLYTEDMQASLLIEGRLHIVNPFA